MGVFIRQGWDIRLTNIDEADYLNLLERATQCNTPGVFAALLSVRTALEGSQAPDSISLGWVAGWYANMDFNGESFQGKGLKKADKKTPKHYAKIKIWNRLFRALPSPNKQEEGGLVETFSACAHHLTKKNFIIESFDIIFIAHLESVLEKLILEKNLLSQAGTLRRRFNPKKV